MKGIAARLWAWLRRTTLASAGALRSFAVWVSPLPRLIPALLIAVFALSLLAWAFLDRQSSYVLYFPDHRGKTFGGELRDLPWRSTAEDRAELLVSEFLLGPRDPRLLPALPPTTRLVSILLRKGTLYVDLGEETALLPRPELEKAILALRKTLNLGFRQAGRLVVTIGGWQPWAEAPGAAGAAKKAE